MAQFVRIGKRRLNLDLVRLVVEDNDGENCIATAYFSPAEKPDYYGEMQPDAETFFDEQAWLLLALVDQDDEAVDRLYERVNGSKGDEPETILTSAQDEELAAVTIQTDEELAAADRDERPYYDF